MRHFMHKVTLPILALLVLAACGDTAETPVDTPTGDESAAAAETVTSEADPSPTDPDSPTPDTENVGDANDVPTPDPKAVDEWLETAPTFQGIAQGPGGELYVGYPRHAAVLSLSTEGELLDAWGEEVRLPSAIEVDEEGTVYVVDLSAVRVYDSDGTHVGQVGEFGFEEGHIAEPASLAFSGDGGLFVFDERGVRIMHFSPEAEFVNERAEPAWLLETAPDGNLFALNPFDTPPLRMEKRSTDLEVIDEWDVQVMEQAETVLDDSVIDDEFMALPVAMDSGPDDRLYILSALVVSGPDAPEHGIVDLQVLVYEPDGELVDSWHAESDSVLDRPLPQPGGLAVTGDGDVLIVDSAPQTHRILRFSTDGELLGEWNPEVPAFLCDLDPDAFQGLSCG